MSPFELGPQAEALAPPFALQGDTKLIVTLYDLIPLIRPDHYLAEPNFAKRYRARLELIRGADLVFTISEHTREDGLRLLGLEPERVVTIGAGVSRYFRETSAGDNPRALLAQLIPELRGPYVFTVAGAEERKNTERLIQAYARLPADLRRNLSLVISCQLPEAFRSSWLKVARDANLRPEELLLTDFIEDSTLRALYQEASLFVFPSLYEGFGLPAAEASACGCPTITSNTSSLPEVLKLEEATFDPSDVNDISRLIERGVTDQGFAERLRLAGRAAATEHSWETVAQKTVEALQLLPSPVGDYQVTVPAMETRIALAGPFPPVRSGIADYNHRLVHELAKICSVDLLTVGEVDRSLFRNLPETRCFPISALGRTLNPAAYDAIIYTFGNNEHHHLTYDMAIRYPGVVWLHDVRLAGFYLSYAEASLGPSRIGEYMGQKMSHLYAHRAPRELMENVPSSMSEYVEFGLGMSGEMVRSSRAVVVNSDFASRLLTMDQGPAGPCPPLAVIPLAASDPASSRPRQKSPSYLIGSFGMCAAVKAPDLLIESLALIRKRLPVRLIFVGFIRSDYRPVLQAKAAAAGVADYVTFAGDVGRDQYEEWLQKVDCAVQIRLSTNGESSAAVNDCLTAGVPVLTNIQACKEMPPGTVESIEPDPSPATLSAQVETLLSDKVALARLSANGIRYAANHSFESVAGRILGFIKTLEPCQAFPAEALLVNSVALKP